MLSAKLLLCLGRLAKPSCHVVRHAHRTHGASSSSEQGFLLFSTPLMQQDVLSRPAADPAVLQPDPPHWVHSRGQLRHLSCGCERGAEERKRRECCFRIMTRLALIHCHHLVEQHISSTRTREDTWGDVSSSDGK